MRHCVTSQQTVLFTVTFNRNVVEEEEEDQEEEEKEKEEEEEEEEVTCNKTVKIKYVELCTCDLN